MKLDKQYHKRTIAGVDECGCSSFAGSIVASAVIINDIDIPRGTNDSKLLSEKTRRRLSKIIKEKAIDYSISSVSAEIINKMGFGFAHKLVMERAVKKLKNRPDFVLFDYHALGSLAAVGRLSLGVLRSMDEIGVENAIYSQTIQIILMGF